MCEPQKKNVWPSTVTVLIGLPVLYVALFGPACWLATSWPPLRRPVNSIYSPAARAYFKTPNAVGIAINWYANIGGYVDFYGTELGGFRLAFEPDIEQDYSFPPPKPQ